MRRCSSRFWRPRPAPRNVRCRPRRAISRLTGFVWTASTDTARKAAFLAVLDLRDGSPTQGKVVGATAQRVTPVYAFEGKNCAVPVVMGKYWLQTVPDAHAVVVLDISNPMAPREVSRVDMGTIGLHWLASDASGRHLVTNSGSNRDSNLLPVNATIVADT